MEHIDKYDLSLSFEDFKVFREFVSNIELYSETYQETYITQNVISAREVVSPNLDNQQSFNLIVKNTGELIVKIELTNDGKDEDYLDAKIHIFSDNILYRIRQYQSSESMLAKSIAKDYNDMLEEQFKEECD